MAVHRDSDLLGACLEGERFGWRRRLRLWGEGGLPLRDASGWRGDGEDAASMVARMKEVDEEAPAGAQAETGR